MSVSGISSSSFMNLNAASIQNQQQQMQQQFQALAQEFQSGNLSSAQTTALTQNPPQVSGTLATPTSAPTAASSDVPSSTQTAHGHSHHHRHIQSDTDSDQDTSTTPSLGQLGQAIQSGSASTAQQAYGSLSQDLQQVALNSDLINAQSAELQSSGLSLTA